ncbi:MAG TPA: 23S rRNA (pseudouridine(1915)-N(3))-methyltransferase RlmH [Bacilli bacterium]|nr:23S rRNA (pseudouridine(1915)-N(3))-methyltransferase RlmH [Bacilli bacterium]HPS18828.1 23S rRNA (pseudouridine(1915)-N(3))-methyltransferase RlmH [Bacilli bacterium]
MRIRILTVGKIKEAYLKEGIAEYVKRLKPYASIEIIEVADEAVSEKASNQEIEIAKQKEGEKLLKIIKDNEFVISLDLNQRQYTSPEFAQYLSKAFQDGGASVTFVIGGSYGLSGELKKRANQAISLSNMTFLHQMTRLILLEQIYRAFKINRNEVYHK